MRRTIVSCLAIFLLVPCWMACHRQGDQTSFDKWEAAGGNSFVNKYSSLTEIDTSNVRRLQPVWTYHTGDMDTAAHSQIQCSPSIVNGDLYGTSPQLKLFALDAATGVEK